MRSQTILTQLQQIAQQAADYPDTVFTTLTHKMDIPFLTEAYRRTKKTGVPGIDNMTAKDYAAENLAFRHQLAVMKGTNKRPKIRMADRFFWVLLSRIWTPWHKSLIFVKPDTVVYWHRKGFKLFWKFKYKGPGRPQVSREIRDLVRRMAAANPNWGAPRIHGELLSLGFEVSERTVSNLMPRRPPNSKPSQTWRTFLKTQIVLI